MRTDSPFAKLLGMMREEGGAYNPPSILLSEVVTAEPLTIKVGELQIDRDNLLVADYLLNNTEMWNGLVAGDLLAVMPTEDRQTFIILARVVKP